MAATSGNLHKSSVRIRSSTLENSPVIQEIKEATRVYLQKYPAKNGGVQFEDGLEDNYIGFWRIPIDVWNAIPKAQRQRTTEKRSEGALRKFERWHPDHRYGKLAVKPNLELSKADAMTRTDAWAGVFEHRNMFMPQPEYIYVIVEFCWNQDEVNHLYEIQDNEKARKTSQDHLDGAQKTKSMSLESPLLKRNLFKSAVEGAHQRVYGTAGKDEIGYVDRIVGEWAGELEFLDVLNPKQNALHVPNLIGVLISIRRYQGNHQINKFLKDYFNNRGFKQGGFMDGIQALNEAIQGEKKTEGVTKKRKKAKVTKENMVGKTISCIEKYMAGKLLNEQVRVLGSPRLLKTYKEIRDNCPPLPRLHKK